MKSKIFRLRLMLLLTLFGCGKVLYSQNILLGDWKAQCISEKINESSMKFDDLCPFSLEDAMTLRFGKLALSFTEEYLLITVDGKLSPVNYSFDEKNNTLYFKFNDKDFNYNVLEFIHSENLMLKGESGTLVFLEKI